MGSKISVYSRWRVTWMAPGMSSGFSGGSRVTESARCSSVLGSLCDPGTMYRQESSHNALRNISSWNFEEYDPPHVFHCTCARSSQLKCNRKRHAYPMRPGSESIHFFFRRRIFSHVVSMPSKSEIIIQRVDQHVKQL